MKKKPQKKCKCKKCVKFRKKHPFEYLDIYGLYFTFAKFLAPRLKAFKKYTFSFPANIESKEWDITLDKMIFAFEIFAKDDIIIEDKQCEKIKEGIDLFAKYFRDLWI